MGVLNTITCNMDIDVSMLDLKQLFFNNLVLLGFDAHSMEAANHIPFNKSMFELPNKRGAEIVLYYLFQRLNATMCKEAFRDCWPILDKKREQSFRKTCYNWLSNISQEEPDSHLPRINASLFMSPGGDKFYQMLFHFSGYVLQKVLETELGSKLTDRLRYPTLSQDNLQLGEVIIKTLACSSVRHRTNYFTAAQLNIKANRTWKETADEYVKEYRKLNKEVRELDFQYREEEQRSVEAAMARGSPAKRRSGQDDKFDSEFDPRTIKRSQRIQQVREMWKQVEDFDRNKEAEREVVESIVQKTINKYKLDGSDINVKVPDMLLRECGEEIRRRNVDNTYQGGKLNLVSVLQLWSLCLHLYLEKLNQVGLPKFEEEVKKLTAQAHLQQNYAQNAQTLRQQMSERIPVLKSSIEKLSQKLDSTLFVDQSPESIRTTVSEPVSSKTQTVSQDFDCHKSVRTIESKPVRLKNKTSAIPRNNKILSKQDKLLYNRSKVLTKANNDRITSDNTEIKSYFSQAMSQVVTSENVGKVEQKQETYDDKHGEVQGGENIIVRSLGTDPCNLTELPNKCIYNPCQTQHKYIFDKVSYSDPMVHGCMECGPKCVCNKTAVAMTSDLGSSCSVDYGSISTDTPSNDQTIISEQIKGFEDTLKAAGFHPDLITSKLKFSSISDEFFKPVLDSSNLSISSGYHSYKSKVSVSPCDDLISDEISACHDCKYLESSTTSSNDPTPLHIHTICVKEQSDSQTIVDKCIRVCDIKAKFCPSKPSKKFLPLKDMALDESLTSQHLVRQSVCPLLDKTDIEFCFAEKHDWPLQSVDLVGISSPCRKFSPLKDMSFLSDSFDSDDEPRPFGFDRNVQDKGSQSYRSKYIEVNSQTDDIITLGSPSILEIDEFKSDQTDLELPNRNSVILTSDNNAHLLCNSGLSKTPNIIEVVDSNPRSDYNDVVTSSLYKCSNSDVEKSKTAYKFFRSPKGTLKHVRFSLPSET